MGDKYPDTFVCVWVNTQNAQVIRGLNSKRFEATTGSGEAKIFPLQARLEVESRIRFQVLQEPKYLKCLNVINKFVR
jgi:hypothetical protein